MKKLILRTVVAILTLPIWFLAGSPTVQAEEMTCPDHTPVTIDIKPGEDPSKIRLSARGLLPVAVLTTENFDASLFTPEMAHLQDANTVMTMGCSGAMAVRWNLDDVNRDGQFDLVFFFKIQDLDLISSSTYATLMAHGSYGSTIPVLHIEGMDSVLVKP